MAGRWRAPPGRTARCPATRRPPRRPRPSPCRHRSRRRPGPGPCRRPRAQPRTTASTARQSCRPEPGTRGRAVTVRRKRGRRVLGSRWRPGPEAAAVADFCGGRWALSGSVALLLASSRGTTTPESSRAPRTSLSAGSLPDVVTHHWHTHSQMGRRRPLKTR